ncbi:MAG: hypothetical protein D6717_07180 [Gammaproteobacteria bacterium]|nr:MAG: hypothetical protein D6717_07180 [Gammaproteobacteria bacterium]
MNGSFDYICFDTRHADEFRAFLEARGVPYETRPDSKDPEHLVVSVPDDLDDALDEAVEETYERLEREYEQRLKQELIAEDQAEKRVTAISVNLASGETCYVPIPEEMMNRLLRVLSTEEIGELVDAIVSAVEARDTRPICHHVQDD